MNATCILSVLWISVYGYKIRTGEPEMLPQGLEWQ